jgi:hypothetical protein
VEVSDDVDEAIAQVYRACDSHPHRSHLRIAAKKGHPILSAIDEFQLKYPFIHFTKKVLDDETDAEEKMVEIS